MGNLEQGSTSEILFPPDAKIPPEVAKMDQNLVGEAKIIFENNHQLVKEAMFGMGSRKAKEVMEELAECRQRTKEIVRKFRENKKKIYPRS